MDIKNTTSRPIRVPLPAGKRLFLPPGGKGQITPKAAEHPPVQALIDAGDLELQGGSKSPKNTGTGGSTGKGPGSAGPSSGGIRHTGDR